MTDISAGREENLYFSSKISLKRSAGCVTMDHNTRTNALATRTRGGDDA